jgi:hypothetical protein
MTTTAEPHESESVPPSRPPVRKFWVSAVYATTFRVQKHHLTPEDPPNADAGLASYSYTIVVTVDSTSTITLSLFHKLMREANKIAATLPCIAMFINEIHPSEHARIHTRFGRAKRVGNTKCDNIIVLL